jgi:hypothetical protein
MRFLSALLVALFTCIGFAASAQAEPVVSIVFSGNSWGYLKPCPT